MSSFEAERIVGQGLVCLQDLLGLVRPQAGQHASQMNAGVPNERAIAGPPLVESFREFEGTSDVLHGLLGFVEPTECRAQVDVATGQPRRRA